jgi:hypothetical protein
MAEMPKVNFRQARLFLLKKNFIPEKKGGQQAGKIYFSIEKLSVIFF